MATCPNCGEENSVRARFCSNCATPLLQAPTPQAEERKIVTVLFCDLVGFTAASDHADPEDIRARIRPYHGRLRPEIEAFGGTVEKFIGDAVMAVFGAPTAHEDDPERAVRTGLRILEAISELNAADPELALQVRVGIETGEAVVSLGARPEKGEGIVTGDVVNTASRLQGAAPVNGVVVGEGTHQATRDIFEYEALEPVILKGKAEPIPLFRARAARSRLGTDLTRRLSTPLVGRELERTLLTGVFERSIAGESVHLVTIVGEAGVGKSRMVGELLSFVERWPDLVRWRQGRCLPYGTAVTFWALGEILKAEAGILETDSPEVAVSKIDAAVPDGHPDAPWLRQRLRPLIGLEAHQATREENFAAWRAFLEQLAGERPSVFVFEDLHWADDALLAFLEYLAEEAKGLPMLLVATARPELLERVPTWAGTVRPSKQVTLSTLTESETARLIANLLEQAVLPAEVQQAILERSGGNPLYAEQFVRLLKDRGILNKIGETWSIEPGAEIPLPAGVQGMIAARLDTLPAEVKRVLQDASVIGKVFWSGAVAEMGEQDRAEIQHALAELVRRDLIQAAATSSMEQQAEYAFSHALVRDVAYAQIPRASRSERHQRAASWIEEVAGERVEDLAEILAAHYSTALELATAAKRPHAEELQAKALRYLVLAGDRAMGIDVETAERHYSRALAVAADDDPESADILARHGDALSQRGRLPEAVRAFEGAIQAFRTRGDIRRTAVALSRQSFVLHAMGDSRFRAVSSEALAMLEPLGPSPELIQALTEQARTKHLSGEQRSAIDLADSAISLAAELGLPEPARAVGYRAVARGLLGDPGGVEEMRRALDAAFAQGLGREVSVLYNNLAEFLWPIQGPRARLEILREGLSFAERRGVEQIVLAIMGNTMDALVGLGSYDEAMDLSRELVPRLEKAEDVFRTHQARILQACVHARRGEYGEAATLAEWAVERARETADPQVIASAYPVGAMVRLGIGDEAGATALLVELEGTANVQGTGTYAERLPDATRAALAAGAAHLAARLSEGVEPTYPLYGHALTTARALLAEDLENYTEAAELFAEVAVQWERFEMPWERGQALLGESRCLLALGRPAEASQALQQAQGIFASIGARPALSETDALLERATAPTS